eukprot:COSAG01_NODE_25748_length_734_cov_2.774803_1_plen_170_part_01
MRKSQICIANTWRGDRLIAKAIVYRIDRRIQIKKCQLYPEIGLLHVPKDKGDLQRSSSSESQLSHKIEWAGCWLLLATGNCCWLRWHAAPCAERCCLGRVALFCCAPPAVLHVGAAEAEGLNRPTMGDHLPATVEDAVCPTVPRCGVGRESTPEILEWVQCDACDKWRTL